MANIQILYLMLFCFYAPVILLSALFLISIASHFISFFSLRLYLFIFRAREKEGEREGEKHQCVAASHESPAGDLACNPGMCPDWELNRRSFGSQAGTQSTEPHQPGPKSLIYIVGSIMHDPDHFFPQGKA